MGALGITVQGMGGLRMLRVPLLVCVQIGLVGCGPTLKYNLGPAPMRPNVTVNIAFHEGLVYVDGRRFSNGIDAGNAALDKSPAVIAFWTCPGADRDQRGQFPSMQLGGYLSGRFQGTFQKSRQSAAGQNGCPEQPEAAPRKAAAETSGPLSIVLLNGGSYRIGDRGFGRLDEVVNHVSSIKPSELIVVLCSLTRFEEFERDMVPAFQRRGLIRPVLIPGSETNCPAVR